MLKLAELKDDVESIVSSYEARIESISSVFDTTHLVFGPFRESVIDNREKREKINTLIRDTLAKNENLRKKDFDNMIKSVPAVQDQREMEIKNSLKAYFNEQVVTTRYLRNNLIEFKHALAKKETERVLEFQGIIRGLLKHQATRKQDVVFKLKEFQAEQQETAKKLKTLLAKGKELRIKDLRSLLKEFNVRREDRLTLQKERKEDISKMLTGFRKERQVNPN